MKRFKPILSIPVVYRNLFHPLKASTVTISLAESTIDYGDDAVITVSIPSDATGYVECIVGNEYYSKQLISTVGNNAIFTVSGLTTGTKPIVVNYLGNNEYGSCNGSSSIEVQNVISDCTLTINYLEQGTNTVLSPQYTNTYTPGSPYDLSSPVILDYSLVDPSESRVSGTITEDTVINVYYTRDSYTLTITYVDGSTHTSIAPTYTGQYYSGEQYSVTSPVIAGYAANRPTVTGTMPSQNIPVQVIYMPTAPGPDPEID